MFTRIFVHKMGQITKKDSKSIERRVKYHHRRKNININIVPIHFCFSILDVSIQESFCIRLIGGCIQGIFGCILAKANVRTFVHSFPVLFIRTFISEINSPSCLPFTASSFQQISVLLCRVAFSSDKRNAREKQRSKEDARRCFRLRDFVKKMRTL